MAVHAHTGIAAHLVQDPDTAGILLFLENVREPAIDIVAVITTLANPARVLLGAPVLAARLAQRRKPVLSHSYALPSRLGRSVLAEADAVICPSVALLARTAAVSPLLNLPARMTDAPSGSGKLGEYAAKSVLAECRIYIAPFRLAYAGRDRISEMEFNPVIVHPPKPGLHGG